MQRAGIGEGVPADKINRSVDMFGSIAEAGTGTVDMGVAADALRRPCYAAMGIVGGGIAMALVAMCSGRKRRIPGRRQDKC